MPIPSLQISSRFSELGLEPRLGCLSAKVQVAPATPAIKLAVSQTMQDVARELDEAPAQSRAQIAATRKAYKSLGKDPARYRPSAEALTRRALQGKDLYSISNVVDCVNLTSLTTGHSIGAYDLDRVVGDITFDRGGEDQDYLAIGRGPFNIANLPVFYDSQGPFGSPTSDSERTKITDNTETVLMVLIAFGPEPDLSDATKLAQSLLEDHCDGRDIESWIVP